MRCSKCAAQEPRSFHPQSAGMQKMFESFSPHGGTRFQNGVVHALVLTLGIEPAQGFVEAAWCPRWRRSFPAARRLPADIAARHSPASGPTTGTFRCSSRNSRRQETARRPLFRGFSRKRRTRMHFALIRGAGLDIPVSGFGAGGLNAHHHDVLSRGGQRNSGLQILAELLLFLDHLVGGKKSKHRLRIPAIAG